MAAASSEAAWTADRARTTLRPPTTTDHAPQCLAAQSRSPSPTAPCPTSTTAHACTQAASSPLPQTTTPPPRYRSTPLPPACRPCMAAQTAGQPTTSAKPTWTTGSARLSGARHPRTLAHPYRTTRHPCTSPATPVHPCTPLLRPWQVHALGVRKLRPGRQRGRTSVLGDIRDFRRNDVGRGRDIRLRRLRRQHRRLRRPGRPGMGQCHGRGRLCRGHRHIHPGHRGGCRDRGGSPQLHQPG